MRALAISAPLLACASPAAAEAPFRDDVLGLEGAAVSARNGASG